MLGDHLTNLLQGTLFRKFNAEIMNKPDNLDMGEMGMDGTGLKGGITCKLYNKTDPGCPQECVCDCDKVGRINGANQCPDGGTHNVTYNAVILDKGERSWAVRSYADVTR